MLKNRLLYLLVFMVIMQFIYIYEHNMTYAALYSMAVLPVVSLIAAMLLRRGLVVHDELSSEEIIKGDVIKYTVTISNKSLLPCTGLHICFNADEMGLASDIQNLRLSMPPLGNRAISFSVGAKYRGSYSVGIKSITLYDILGIFSFRQKHQSSISFLVNPRIRELQPPALKTSISEAANRASLNEDYSLVSDLRRYQPTDGFKKIHWKASAKRNELISKLFHSAQQESVIIFTDNSRKGVLLEHILELEDKIVEALVSVMASLQGHTYTLHCMGVEPASGNLGQLYGIAAATEFVKNESFEACFESYVLQHDEATNIIVLAQNISNQLEASLCKLAEAGKTVHLIYFEKHTASLKSRISKLEDFGIFCSQPI